MRRIWTSVYKWGNCNLWKPPEGGEVETWADKVCQTHLQTQERSLYNAIRRQCVCVCVGIARRRYCKLLTGLRSKKIAVLIRYTEGTYRNTVISWPCSYGLKCSYTCPFIETYKGNRRTSPLNLNFARWRWVVFTLRPPYPGQITAVLTEHETGWVVERDWKCRRRDNSPAFVGIRTQEHPACNLVAVQSAVSIYVLVFLIQIYPIHFHSGFPPRCRWGFSSSWMLRSVVCWQ